MKYYCLLNDTAFFCTTFGLFSYGQGFDVLGLLLLFAAPPFAVPLLLCLLRRRVRPLNGSNA